MKLSTTIIIASLLSGCATRGAEYIPMVDTKGQDASMLSQNVSECQAYARQRMDAAEGAIAGAIIGALFMAVMMPRGYRNEAAGQGAIVGAAGGALGATENQETIIKRCLAGRGYSVLN